MNELFNKIIKYILMSLITFISILFIPSSAIDTFEGLMITFIVTIFYAILDRILPSIYFDNNDENKS